MNTTEKQIFITYGNVENNIYADSEVWVDVEYLHYLEEPANDIAEHVDIEGVTYDGMDIFPIIDDNIRSAMAEDIMKDIENASMSAAGHIDIIKLTRAA